MNQEINTPRFSAKTTLGNMGVLKLGLRVSICLTPQAWGLNFSTGRDSKWHRDLAELLIKKLFLHLFYSPEQGVHCIKIQRWRPNSCWNVLSFINVSVKSIHTTNWGAKLSQVWQTVVTKKNTKIILHWIEKNQSSGTCFSPKPSTRNLIWLLLIANSNPAGTEFARVDGGWWRNVDRNKSGLMLLKNKRESSNEADWMLIKRRLCRNKLSSSASYSNNPD